MTRQIMVLIRERSRDSHRALRYSGVARIA